MVCSCGTTAEHSRRKLKKAVQQGRSERRPDAYPLGYVEGLNDARTTLADFFSILLVLIQIPIGNISIDPFATHFAIGPERDNLVITFWTRA